MLRTSLLTRYFGKSFVQKHDNMDLGAYQLSSVMHGPGGIIIIYIDIKFIDL